MTKVESDEDLKDYFSGERLYGDDLCQEKIDVWYSGEAEGYFNLVQAGAGNYAYGYHALNERHGFSRLPERRFSHVLGVGSAYGEELSPILGRSDRVSILEPSEGFRQEAIHGVPVAYVKPHPTGTLPFPDSEFDLITCFGVLHHIPNVGKIINEYCRVLKAGGYVLIREPIISMGDWRRPRPGLTRHERGIPLAILRDMVRKAGFEIRNEQKCMFSLTSRLHYVMSRPVYDSPLVAVLDQCLCALPVWSKAYHARNVLQKVRPSAVFLVLRKPT